MITAQIEKALISGKARLCTYMLNNTAVGKIKVPANCFIIITDITVHPFSENEEGLNQWTPQKADETGTHVIEITNQNEGRVGFIFRNTALIYRDPVYETVSVVNSPAMHFNTYLVREKDCYVQIGTVPGIPKAKNKFTGNLDATTQDPAPPKGYGTTLQVITAIEDQNNAIYQQAEGPYNLNNLPGTQLYDQPYPNYLDPGAQVSEKVVNNLASPCVTIQYVVVNEQVRQNFQG